jgi:hypothetical protein
MKKVSTVAHARKVRLIGESRKKDDRLDAQTLARLTRIDPELLCPVKHRSAQAQAHLKSAACTAFVGRMANCLRHRRHDRRSLDHSTIHHKYDTPNDHDIFQGDLHREQ